MFVTHSVNSSVATLLSRKTEMVWQRAGHVSDSSAPPCFISRAAALTHTYTGVSDCKGKYSILS